jgi:nicotinamidase-related amidase
MTTLEGRPNTALLVIDTQNAILAGADGRDGVVANIGRLVAYCWRGAGTVATGQCAWFRTAWITRPGPR